MSKKFKKYIWHGNFFWFANIWLQPSNCNNEANQKEVTMGDGKSPDYAGWNKYKRAVIPQYGHQVSYGGESV